MKKEDQSIPAIMRIEEGETIAGMWVSPTIPDVGFYKLLAKRTANGLYEWVHFLQKPDGSKHSVFNGTTKSEEELRKVVEAVNATLNRIYGSNILLVEGKPTFYSLDGTKQSDTIH